MITDSLQTELQFISTRDLRAEAESWQWLSLDVADHGDDESRTYGEMQVAAVVAELERRQRLLKARSHDPLAPRWPIDRFCADILGAHLIPAGQSKWKARCPLPGHDDKTPSFFLDEAKAVAECHGCQRGGDVIRLVQLTTGERFYTALERLEALA